MTLSPPVTRIQQLSPNAVALQAAALSFGKNPPPSPRQTPDAGRFVDHASRGSSPTRKGTLDDNISLVTIQPSYFGEFAPERPSKSIATTQKTPLHSGSSSMLAANLATARSGRSPKRNSQFDGREAQEDIPEREFLDVRQKVFCKDTVEQDSSSPVKRRNRPPELEFHGVDSTSLDDISVLKNLFENSTSQQPATARPIRSTRSEVSSSNPSLTAALLATQLSPRSSTQNSRPSSPTPRQIPTSVHGSPRRRNFNDHSDSVNVFSEIPRPDVLKKSRTGVSQTSQVLVTDSNNALLAATLASKYKDSSGQTKSHPPKPPPSRRAPKATSNGSVSDLENMPGRSLHSRNAPTIPPKLEVLPASKSFLPPSPRGRQSVGQLSRKTTGDGTTTALAAAVRSTASSRVGSRGASASPARADTAGLPRHLTGDSLRAAMLAPSRTVSVSPKKPPAPPAPRRGRRKSLPPPPKTVLRETMRKPLKPTSKNSSPQRHKSHLVKHHPHKHSEGERKRWRHFVTEAERKRYEGLWAANRGLLLVDQPQASHSVSPSIRSNSSQTQHVWSSMPNYKEALGDCVDSLVARDIWARSRLPFDHLADVWDLVDRKEKGYLSRDEFVVGTWLIDQSLKGRKLPSRVQDEVWQSVRRLGVTVQAVGNRNGRR